MKPRWEGTAKGIRPSSRVDDAARRSRAEVARIVRDYAQPALVERFLPGAEYTVCVVGNAPPRALPALQRALERDERDRHPRARRTPAPAGGVAHVTPGALTPALERELAALAVPRSARSRCRDFARADWKLDAAGRPQFLEINPLPTFAPDGSFAILAELSGATYDGLPGAEVLARGFGGSAFDRAPVCAAPRMGGSRRLAFRWTWQIRNRIRSAADLARFVEPAPDEVRAIEALAERFRFVITPYYASLMDPDDPACPIRRQVVPRLAELDDPPGLADPLDEVAHSPVKNVVRVYRDRIAFCVNNECALYCRFCLRKRMVGDEEWTMQRRELEAALAWIRATPEIRDVLLTGGDPLVFSDDRLGWLLGELRAIPHVEIVRLGTRLPVTLPFRVTAGALRAARAPSPDLAEHALQPPEASSRAEAAEACARLASAGVPIGNQSVLLAGINDDVATMQALCEGLVRMRVRPYYCYQAQLLEGTAHFRVPIERGIELFRALRGRTSGFAIPQYVLDTPLGKVPLSYPYLRGREGDDVVVESYDGRIWREPNPA